MWAPVTSDMDWCETNYAVVPFIAEFANTLSSLPVASFALHGMLHVYRQGFEWVYLLLYFSIVGVGLGSATFHGTLTWQGQAVDELPMVWTATLCLYASLTLTRKKLWWTPLAIFLFSLARAP